MLKCYWNVNFHELNLFAIYGMLGNFGPEWAQLEVYKRKFNKINKIGYNNDNFLEHTLLGKLNVSKNCL